MDVKEYLWKPYEIEQTIALRKEEIVTLRNLATQTNQVLSDMPGSSSKNLHKMENIIVKIASIEEDIQKQIEEMVDAKCQIIDVINSMDNYEYQMILTKRYLQQESWKEIASEMGYHIRHIYRIHNEALNILVDNIS